jgi:hypothetical protein
MPRPKCVVCRAVNRPTTQSMSVMFIISDGSYSESSCARSFTRCVYIATVFKCTSMYKYINVFLSCFAFNNVFLAPHLFVHEGEEGLPGVASLVLPKRGQRQLSLQAQTKVEGELGRMETKLFNGIRPAMGSEELDHSLQALVEFEVDRYAQEIILLVSRLAWLNILFNKVAERAKEVNSLLKVKERVLQDVKIIYGKVISWISSPTVQRLATDEPFSFLTSLSEVREWKIKDVFEGKFPWMRSARDANDDVQQAIVRELAQRLRVVYSVMNNFAFQFIFYE